MTITKGTFRAAVSLALVLAVASMFALRSLAASTPVDAASRNAVRLEDSPAPFVGKLTGTGHLMIDGEAAQPGATVVSGSRVATGADGAAVIDLNALGQIALRSNTSIRLTFTASAVSVMIEGAGRIDGSFEAGVTGKLQAEGARLRLGEGEANLHSASGTRWLRAGETVALTADAEAILAGGATFTAEGGTAVAQQPATEQAASPTPAPEPTVNQPQVQSGATTATEGGSSTPTGTPTPVPPRVGVTTAGVGGFIALAGVAAGVATGIARGGSHGSSSSPTVRPSTVTP